MRIYPSLPASAEAPMSAILRGLNAATTQAIIQPLSFSNEQRRLAGRMQEYNRFVALVAPGTCMSNQSGQRLPCVRRIKKDTFAARGQADSCRTIHCWYPVTRANEAIMYNHVVRRDGLVQSQPFEGCLSQVIHTHLHFFARPAHGKALTTPGQSYHLYPSHYSA